MQKISEENLWMTGIALAIFVLGLIGGYMATTHDPLGTIILFFGIGLLMLMIAKLTIVKPSNYIPFTLKIIRHPNDQNMVKLKWDITNNSEEVVRVYRYKIRVKNAGKSKVWRSHEYDLLLDEKSHHYEEFEFKPASYYKIANEGLNEVTVTLDYMAADGKTGISLSKTRIDLSLDAMDA